MQNNLHNRKERSTNKHYADKHSIVGNVERQDVWIQILNPVFSR